MLTGAGKGFCSGDDVKVIFRSGEGYGNEGMQGKESTLSFLQDGRSAGGGGPLLTTNKPSVRISRWNNQDELDILVEAWTLQHDHYEVMYSLHQAGVAAGVIPTGPELLADPHLKERGMFQVVDRAVVGPHPYPRSSPMKLSESPDEKRQPSPLLGEHNHYVLHELLGLSGQELESMAEENIIGTEPLI